MVRAWRSIPQEKGCCVVENRIEVFSLFVTRVLAALSIPRRYAGEGASISINHTPPSLVVDQGVSYVEGCSALDFPFMHDAWPHDLSQNKFSNINRLEFYH